ncbi:MAG TPA: hypothetical protein VFQ53_30650 [Kofleriaceae bacterium]|nr:hypothetical protein [Kofleriaceae bacterium]
MTAEQLLRGLLALEPRTLGAFETLSGPLAADIDGEDWFFVSRPRALDDTFSVALDRVGLTFDPFHETGDPPIESMRLTLRLACVRAVAIATELRGRPDAGQIEGAPTARFGAFHLRDLRGATLLDWVAEPADAAGVAAFDPAVRARFVAELPALLAAATTPAQLARATAPAPAAGTVRRAGSFTRAGERMPAHAPRVTLHLDPPHDARALASAWQLAQPLAVSGDVHQRSWMIVLAGEPVSDPHRPRIAALPIRFGAWQLRPQLAGRPPGPRPDLACGASPAYDVVERGGDVVAIEIVPV